MPAKSAGDFSAADCAIAAPAAIPQAAPTIASRTFANRTFANRTFTNRTTTALTRPADARTLCRIATPSTANPTMVRGMVAKINRQAPPDTSVLKHVELKPAPDPRIFPYIEVY